eukprot:397721-Prorocentrum_minimum.AAC.1
MSRPRHTYVTPASQPHHARVTLMSRPRHNPISPASHECHARVTTPSRPRHTSVTPASHSRVTPSLLAGGADGEGEDAAAGDPPTEPPPAGQNKR